MPPARGNTALKFRIKAKCNVSKARSSVMSLPHADVETPVFMPVGTQVRIEFRIHQFLYVRIVVLLLCQFSIYNKLIVECEICFKHSQCSNFILFFIRLSALILIKRVKKYVK